MPPASPPPSVSEIRYLLAQLLLPLPFARQLILAWVKVAPTPPPHNELTTKQEGITCK